MAPDLYPAETGAAEGLCGEQLEARRGFFLGAQHAAAEGVARLSLRSLAAGQSGRMEKARR